MVYKYMYDSQTSKSQYIYKENKSGNHVEGSSKKPNQANR